MQNQGVANVLGRKFGGNRPFIRAVLAFGCIVVTSCSSGSDVVLKKEVRRDWFYPTRKQAPEEVYNRLRDVRPPEPVPEAPRSVEKAPRLFPVVQLNIKNGTLSEVARILAQSYRYGHYCSPLVAQQRMSVRAIGTLDELADQVAHTGMVRVSVDHENREVRILSGARVHQIEQNVQTPVVSAKSVDPRVRKRERPANRPSSRPTDR